MQKLLADTVKKLLFQVFGEFLEIFPSSEIELNHWQGLIEKRDLNMKCEKIQELFAKIGLPVTIKKGMIGSLSVKIPWTKIWREPLKISLKNVFIYGCTMAEYSEFFPRVRSNDIKQTLVEQIQKQMLSRFVRPIGDHQDGRIIKYIKQFVYEMMIIDIEDLHVRFRDEKVCLRNNPFDFGLHVKQIIFRPTDYDFKEVFVQQDQRQRDGRRFLIFRAEQLAVFINMNQNETIDVLDKKQDFLHNSLMLMQSQKVYLIDPFNFKVKITIDMQNQNQTSAQKIFQFYIDNMTLNLDNHQQTAILKFHRLQEWHCQRAWYLIYRPPFNNKNAKMWMDYLRKIRLMRHQNYKQLMDVERLKYRRMIREEYVELVTLQIIYLIDQTSNKIFTEELIRVHVKGQPRQLTLFEVQDTILEFENYLSLEEIIVLRQKAKEILTSEIHLKQKILIQNPRIMEPALQNQKRYSLFSYFQKPKQLSPIDFEQILDLIKTQCAPVIEEPEHVSSTANKWIRHYQVFMDLIQINLKAYQDKEAHTFIRCDVQNIVLNIQKHSSKDILHISMYSCLCQDYLNPILEFQNILCLRQDLNRSLKKKHEKSELNMLEIYFEKNNAKLKNQITLRISILGMQSSINDSVLLRLKTFIILFKRSDQFQTILLKLQSQSLIKDISLYAQNRIRSLFGNDYLYAIDINLEGLQFNIPETSMRQFSSVLTIDLSKVHLYTPEVQGLLTIESVCTFHVSFSYYAENKKTQIYLIEPFTLSSTFSRQFIQEGQQLLTELSLNQHTTIININIPMIKDNHFHTFLKNVGQTLDNLHKLTVNLQRERVDDCVSLQKQSSQRKQSVSILKSQHSSISRDNLSLNGSDIFYDADEELEFKHVNSSPQVNFALTSEEQKDLLSKKQKQHIESLSYLLDFIYRQADPLLMEILQMIQMRYQLSIPRIKIETFQKRSGQRYRGSQAQFDQIEIAMTKMFHQEEFSWTITSKSIETSLYKIPISIQSSRIQDAVDDLNKYTTFLEKLYEEKYALIPLILKLKIIKMNLTSHIDNVVVSLQDPRKHTQGPLSLLRLKFQDLNLCTKESTQLSYLSPGKGTYNKNLLLVSFNLLIGCSFKVEYYNVTHKIYEPFIESTGLQLILVKTSEVHVFQAEIKKDLLFNVNPTLIEILFVVWQHSFAIQKVNQSLLNSGGFNIPPLSMGNTNQVDKLGSKQTQQFNEDDTKCKYRIDVMFNDEIQQLYIIDIRSTIQVTLQPKIKPICVCVNLSNIELQFINGDQKLNLKMKECFSFSVEPSLRIRPRNDKYGWSCLLRLHLKGTYQFRLVHLVNANKHLFFLVRVCTRQGIKIIQVEALHEAPYVIENRSQQLATYYQLERKDHKIVLEQDCSGQFCWDDPFESKQLLLELQSLDQTQPKYFSVDVDAFINQVIKIDKEFSDTIDSEFTIEIYGGAVKRIVVTEILVPLKEPLLTLSIVINKIGLSLLDSEEILFISCMHLKYKQKHNPQRTSYLLECSGLQVDNQLEAFPLMQTFKDMLPVTQVMLQTTDRTRMSQSDNEGVMRLTMRKKTTTKMCSHIEFIKLTTPQMTVLVDGKIIDRLVQFYITLKEKIQAQSRKDVVMEKDQMVQQGEDVKIHMNKISISSFQVQIRFTNLSYIELMLTQLWSAATIVIFLVNTIEVVSFKFLKYRFKSQEVSLEGNLEAQIREILGCYSKRVIQTLNQHFNGSNLLQGQNQLLRRFNRELDEVINQFQSDELSSQHSGLTLKLYLLRSSLKLGHILFDTFKSSTQSVLIGLQKGLLVMIQRNERPALERMSQANLPTSIMTGISRFFQTMSFWPTSFIQTAAERQFDMSLQQYLNSLKVRRLPRYVASDEPLQEYNLTQARFKVYLDLKRKQGDTQIKLNIINLSQHYDLLLTNKKIILMNSADTSLPLELSYNQYHSASFDEDNNLIFKYFKNDRQQIQNLGMKQFRIEREVVQVHMDSPQKIDLLTKLSSLREKYREKDYVNFM